jgi:phosphocarrier protein
LAEIQLLIRNQLGLHARACALFVKTASKFKSEVFVSRDDLEVNGKSIMGVMMLAAGKGAMVTIEATGENAEAALAALQKLIADKFDEGE